MSKPLIIDYYTDILCVWAWIAQLRVDELNASLTNKIQINHLYMDVFGDVATKIKAQWEKKGGYTGFAEHVQKSVSNYEYAEVNSKIWTEVRPTTSANAHFVLKAIEISHGKNKSIDMALVFRKAFFVDALDIGKLEVLLDLIKSHELEPDKIKATINDGSAMASLMNDYQKSKHQNIKGSPSYVIDEGRQILYGNVGYRVLLANIEGLLKKTSNEASWC